jgi:hypothetical protein
VDEQPQRHVVAIASFLVGQEASEAAELVLPVAGYRILKDGVDGGEVVSRQRSSQPQP